MSSGDSDKRPKTFLAKVGWLVGGNMAARVITFAAMPVITRLFAPEAFGTFAGFESILAILIAICHLRYPAAIFLPEDRREADGVAALSLGVIASFSLLTAAALAVCRPALAGLLDMPPNSLLLWLLPPAVLLGGAETLARQYATRNAAYAPLAGSRVVRTTVARGGGLLDGFVFSASALGLATAHVASQFFTVAWLWRSARLGPALRRLASHGRSELPRLAKRYSRFALYSPLALLQQSSLRFPVLFLAGVYSPMVAGYYALGIKMLREPINLLGEALAGIYLEHVSAMLRAGEDVTAFTRRFFRVLVDISMVPMLLVGVAGVELFTIVFGAEWAEAGRFAKALAPFYAITFVSWPISALFDLKVRQRENLLFNGAYFVLAASSLTIGWAIGGALTSVICFSAASVLIYLIRVLWLLGLIDIPASFALKHLGRNLLRATLPALGIVAISHWAGPWAGSGTALALIGTHLLLVGLRDREFMARLKRRSRP